MPQGEWIELYNHGEKELDLTDCKLKDKANHVLTISDTTTYSTKIKPNDYLVVYTNGKFGFLNNDGLEEIRLFTPQETQIEKITYTDSREGTSWSKNNNAWQLTRPTPGEENPKNPEKERESKIKIERVYLGNDESAKFGDYIRIRLSIYKGDETKESISTYLYRNDKKISKTTSFNIEKKYSNTTITIPLQIYANCNLDYPEGEYTLKVEGLNTKDEEKIKIKGITQNLCEKQVITKNMPSNNIITSETVINQDISPEQEIIYQSKNRKTTRRAIYFFSFILVLLTINLARKKWK